MNQFINMMTTGKTGKNIYKIKTEDKQTNKNQNKTKQKQKQENKTET